MHAHACLPESTPSSKFPYLHSAPELRIGSGKPTRKKDITLTIEDTLPDKLGARHTKPFPFPYCWALQDALKLGTHQCYSTFAIPAPFIGGSETCKYFAAGILQSNHAQLPD